MSVLQNAVRLREAVVRKIQAGHAMVGGCDWYVSPVALPVGYACRIQQVSSSDKRSKEAWVTVLVQHWLK